MNYLDGLLKIPFGAYKKEKILTFLDDFSKNIKELIKDLKDSIAGVTKSSNRVDKAIKEIKKLEEFISGEDDEYTKTY